MRLLSLHLASQGLAGVEHVTARLFLDGLIRLVLFTLLSSSLDEGRFHCASARSLAARLASDMTNAGSADRREEVSTASVFGIHSG